MPIQDPFTLTRTPDKTETRSFSENGIDITLKLAARNDYTRRLFAEEQADIYKQRYVTGKMLETEQVVDGKTVKVAALEISYPRAVGGVIPKVGEWLCNVIARLEVMQVTEGMEQALTFDQWAAYGVLMPKSFGDIAAWSYELFGSSDAKNDSGEAAAP